MSRTRRLWIVLFLNLGLVTMLVITGLAAHSLAVLAAGADYLADAGAIGISLLAIWVASRPRGHPQATNAAALVNASWLLTLNLAIAATAIQHLAAGAHRVEGLPVVVASGIAAAVMLVGALILGGDTDDDDGDEQEDLNVKAVLLDTAADAAAAAAVAVSGAIILAAGGWYWLDPAMALAIAVIISYHALRLLRKITAAIGSGRLSALHPDDVSALDRTGHIDGNIGCGIRPIQGTAVFCVLNDDHGAARPGEDRPLDTWRIRVRTGPPGHVLLGSDVRDLGDPGDHGVSFRRSAGRHSVAMRTGSPLS